MKKSSNIPNALEGFVLTDTPNIDYNSKNVSVILNEYEKILFERQENSILHNSEKWLQNLCLAVASGKRAEVKQALAADFQGTPGTFSNDQSTTLKYLLVTVVIGIRVYIIQNHLIDAETSFTLCDAIMTCIEKSGSNSNAIEITAAGLYIFADKISIYRQKASYHYLATEVKEYIYKNLHTKIQISKIAETLHTHPTYLGYIFKKYEHMTIGEFIRNEKIERAKNMLTYSDYSFDEIAMYLGFSSQSHMGKLLKEATGLTPMQYRQQHSSIYRQQM